MHTIGANLELTPGEETPVCVHYAVSRAERAGYFEIWPREAVFLGVSDPVSGKTLRGEPIVTAAFDWLIEHADDAINGACE